ncbi:DUF3024 domain-containing protein [Pseudomonadota bacterium]
MAFNELDLQRIKKHVGGLCEKRSPVHLRSELRLIYKIENQSVIIFEERPNWRDPDIFTETEIAKMTLVRSHNIWKLYWMRGNLKWHSYDPLSSASNLESLVAEIDEDPLCCFFG